MRRSAVVLVTFLAGVGPASGAPASSTVGGVTVQPVKHATMVLSHDGTTIYVDPVGGGAAFAGLARPDVILITDIHGDHLDAPTVAAVVTENTVVVGPRAVVDGLGPNEKPKARILANGETVDLGGVSVEAVPMYNLTAERAQFHPRGRGNGYVVTLGGKRIYISGDTEDTPEMRALKDIDAAFVCMNLPYTMDVEKAADAVLEFQPRVVLPYHYRGQGGLSDVGHFEEIVSRNPRIEVRLLNWYPE